MSIEVLSPGPLTTVQDRGRTGWRHLGIGVAGALDDDAHQRANLLVGNPRDAATLEITLAGPRLRFTRATRIAVCGADIELRCDGAALSTARPIALPAGAVLALGGCRRGTRAYLAVAGGIDVPPVLGSRSTDLRGGFGGLDGRPLRAGDVLAVGIADCPDVASPQVAPWWIDDAHDSPVDRSIRVLPGADATAPIDALFRAAWRLGVRSDRQGLRLEGARIAASDTGERISAPVAPGTVQLPPDGQPIVLLADAQTHGGYPRIGHVIRADLPRLARLRPGDAVQFAPCTPVEAHAALRARRQTLARVALMIELQSRVPH
ncbi:allophanate hydrolase subunit 2 family protein [Lysobacter sp. TY2-98]|uniref:5-oxoprolinase subunit C family protein n=1 Tax=Lysobacter sp. TY2-98 TaxID=2290922 RepID=UPI000E20626B|nr:biotin-dependent carboxyltransferase family protein [Lysobacter sp. TY2-98]AXK71942.1 allophanate hydrolase subunit 2 family protein [Lysobacter sp. TY2-98]